MSELELYMQCIPDIAEIIVRCRKLESKQYEKWKRETMESAPEATKGFLKKVFIVIEKKLNE